MAVLVSEPGQDFTGGECVITEQRSPHQSRIEMVPPRQGDAVAFPTRHQPMQGSDGAYRVNLRHDDGRIHTEQRHALGSIFHGAV